MQRRRGEEGAVRNESAVALRSCTPVQHRRPLLSQSHSPLDSRACDLRALASSSCSLARESCSFALQRCTFLSLPSFLALDHLVARTSPANLIQSPKRQTESRHPRREARSGSRLQCVPHDELSARLCDCRTANRMLQLQADHSERGDSIHGIQHVQVSKSRTGGQATASIHQ